jgi:DNA-directed RNA polymerase specialized sigma24 family protein
MSSMHDWTPQDVAAALEGDERALRRLVDDCAPTIQARVARGLLRRRALARGEDVRQRLADIAQDVYVELFREGGKVLRAWDPARGMGLHGFVGLVAGQRVAAVLRSRRRNPWAEELMGGDDDDEAETSIQPEPGPEERLLSRDALERLVDLVRAELSPLGLEMFRCLLVEEESIASVSSRTGMTTSAVQAWSSRLRRLVQKLAAEIQGDSATGKESRT